MADVVPFRNRLLDAFACLEHVRNSVAEGVVDFDQPHFKERLNERDVTMRQVLSTMTKGEIIDGPKYDEYGDIRIKMKRYVAGRRVQVVLAVNHRKCVVVTVI